MRILIVEDEAALGDLLQRTLREAAWAPDLVTSGGAALEAFGMNDYDLAVLDVGLPDIDGFEVCRRLRARGGKTPVLMLTARDALSDRVTGLDAGADDYLGKPFAIEELLARLRALARRPPRALDVTLRFGDLELDTAARAARRGTETLRLTLREYALLEYFLRNPRRVLSRSQILAHVWDDNFDPVANVIDVLIGRLRRKLSVAGRSQLLHTVRGMGYVLTEQAPPDAL
jgi:DNA-binding response OmpR family regulator